MWVSFKRMERGRAHLQHQLQTLNKECEITNELLSKLKQKCSNHVNQIVNCDNKTFQLTSKHLVGMLKFQSQSIQKLIEWNISLEKLLADMEPASTVSETADISISSDSCSYMKNTESMIASNETVIEIKPSPKIDDGGNISLDKDIEKEPKEVGVDNDQREINETFDTNLSIHKVIGQNDTPNEKNRNPEKHFQKTIPEQNAPKIGDICKIGFAQSPSVIYIHVMDTNNKSLDVFSMQLSYEYQVSPIIYTPNKFAAREFGNFWIFQDEKDTYRIEVVDWLLNIKSDTVLVQMIDYGWTLYLNYTYLRVLNTNLRNIPRMAQLCHFGHLYPPGSTRDERKQKWPQELNHKFQKILGKRHETYYRIVDVYYCKERKSYGINLIKTSEEDEDNTIGQLLIDFKIAVEIFDGNSDSIIKK